MIKLPFSRRTPVRRARMPDRMADQFTCGVRLMIQHDEQVVASLAGFVVDRVWDHQALWRRASLTGLLRDLE